MTERAPWWKAFLPKKKTGSKEHTIGPDFDPWAPRPDKAKEAAPSSKGEGEQNASSALSDDTYDDSQLDLNEKTFNRTMRVSRSGRFKQKNKHRHNLPIQDNKDSATKDDVR